MERIGKRLHAEIARYNWVGFYLRDKSDPNTLVLGPFTGSFSPHERISIDQGLCGAAVTSGSTVVVYNVADDIRYLPGSEMVKSEIVAPVLALKKVAAVLDINSYFAGTLRRSSVSLLRPVTLSWGSIWRRTRSALTRYFAHAITASAVKNGSPSA